MDLPANIDGAPLPQVYESAKQALTQCQQLDECKDWGDKAAAMASYARQSKDKTLLNLAVKIQARAIRRCGELLREIQARPGARTDIEPRDGTDPRFHGGFEEGLNWDSSPPLTRKQAADDAGLSERQRKQAIRIANIPEDEFNAKVDSDTPPTIKALTQPTRAQPKAEDFSPASIRELMWKMEYVVNHVRDSDVLEKLGNRELHRKDWEEMQTLSKKLLSCAETICVQIGDENDIEDYYR